MSPQISIRETMIKRARQRERRKMIVRIVLWPIRWPLGYCEMCGRWFVYPKTRRMNTAYVEGELNFCRVCEPCFIDIEQHWAEMWEEYRRDTW